MPQPQTFIDGQLLTAAQLNSLSTQAAGAVQAANNLSDVPNAATALANLGGVNATQATAAAPVKSINGHTGVVNLVAADIGGLGGAALLNVGVVAGTVADGGDGRLTGAAQKTANLADLSNASVARFSLGLGGAAILNVGTITGTVAAGDDPRFSGGGGAGGLVAANNLSDVANAGTAATNLGVGATSTPTFAGLTVSGGTTTSNYFANPGGTITLAGSGNPTRPGQFSTNYAGSSTTTGNTTLCNVNIGSASYAASVPNGTFNELLIIGHTAAGFDGGLTGAQVQLILNAPTTLSNANSGLFGLGAKVIGSANAGGASSGFGTTQFGLGSLFGANPWAQMTSGGTFYAQCVGEEVDASIGTGASAANFAVQQLVLTRDHAVHGVVKDVMLSLSAQISTAIGVRNIIGVGDYSSQWPGDPNGYVLQVQRSENGTAATAAGGLDLNQLVASGSGPEGGGFYWRSPNVKILSGEVVAGNGSMASTGAGLVIDTPYQKMSAAAGSITVGAGGTNFTTGDVATDAYGNTVVLVAAGGVVTGVSAVLTTGWQKSPPSNPVAFTARTRTGSGLGSGLTLNLTWSASTSLSLNPTSNGKVVIGGGSANALTITPGATSTSNATLALSGTGILQLTGSTFQAQSLIAAGGTTTLSGSTASAPLAKVFGSYAGSSTITSDTSIASLQVSSTSVAAAVPNGTTNMILVSASTGSGFDGSMRGVHSHVTSNATTATSTGAGVEAFGGTAIGAGNMGGTSTTATIGSIYGINAFVQLQSGATFYNAVVGNETDAEIFSGASANRFVNTQLITARNHAVPGSVTDAILILGAQSQAPGPYVGVRNAILVGDYSSQFPLDPNGYLFQTQTGSVSGVSTVGAGGFDLAQFTASGSGNEGGGFYWRSPNLQLLGGEVQVGNGSIASTGSGLTVDATYQQMTAAAVASGGTGFVGGQIATDAYGNVVNISGASGGVVTAVTIVAHGWQKSPPSNPVAFNARTPATGGQLGSGLTLNLTWTANNVLSLNPSGGAVKFGSGCFSANGSVATALSSVGPTGSHTTVQEWLTFTNAGGVVRYIPAF